MPKPKSELERERDKKKVALMDAMIERAKADATARLADADVRRAEAAHHAAETKGVDIARKRNQLLLNKAKREEEEELTANKFHHVYIFDDAVSATSVSACIKQLTVWMRSAPGCDMEIIFNSPGGDVIEGLALYDFIQVLRQKGHKIRTVALGMAASMAGILLQAGDTRVMGREAWVLIHEACQPGEATALTPDLREIRHDELEPGMELLGFDALTPGSGVGGYRRWGVARVEQVGRAVYPCYEVSLDDGTSHIASGQHLWLAATGNWPTGWVQTEQMNRRLYQGETGVVRYLHDIRQESSWDSGWMAGLLDGEGSLWTPKDRGGSQLALVQVEGAVLERAKAWLDHRHIAHQTQALPGDDRRQARGVLRITNIAEIARLLAITRPVRLLPKFVEQAAGQRINSLSKPRVLKVEPVGDAEVVTLKTSTGTYIGAGLAMHNSFGASGKIGEVEDRVEWVKMIGKRILAIFAARSKLSVAQIERRWKRKDWWLSSEACLKYGFVDEVLP